MLRALARRLWTELQPPTGALSPTPLAVPIVELAWPAGSSRALFDEALRGNAWRRTAQEHLAGIASSGVSHDNAAEVLAALWTVARTASVAPGTPTALVHELAGLADAALPAALDRLPWDSPPTAFRAALQAMATALLLAEMPSAPGLSARAEARAISLVERALGADGVPVDGRLDQLVDLVELALIVATLAGRSGRRLDPRLSDPLGRAAVLIGTLSMPSGRAATCLADAVDGRAAALAAASLARGWSTGRAPPGASPVWCAALGVEPPGDKTPHSNDWQLTSFRAQGVVHAYRHTAKGLAVSVLDAGCAAARGVPPQLGLELDGHPIVAVSHPRLLISGRAPDISAANIELDAARVDGPAASVQVLLRGWSAVSAVERLTLQQARATWSTRLETEREVEVSWRWRLAPGWTLGGSPPRPTAVHDSGRRLKLALDARLDWAQSSDTVLEGSGRIAAGTSPLTFRIEWT